MAGLKEILDARNTLKKYRDEMAKDKASSILAPTICQLNQEIDQYTTRIEEAIKSGRASVKELFLLLDYT